jgi:hypothetical protein
MIITRSRAPVGLPSDSRHVTNPDDPVIAEVRCEDPALFHVDSGSESSRCQGRPSGSGHVIDAHYAVMEKVRRIDLRPGNAEVLNIGAASMVLGVSEPVNGAWRRSAHCAESVFGFSALAVVTESVAAFVVCVARSVGARLDGRAVCLRASDQAGNKHDHHPQRFARNR